LDVCELEVVLNLLKFLVKPAQRFSSQKSLKPIFISFQHKIEMFSQKETFIELIQGEFEAQELLFQYYDQDHKISFKIIPKENVKDILNYYLKIITENTLTKQQQRKLLHQIIVFSNLKTLKSRLILFQIRIFSLTILTCILNEDQITKHLSLEPSLFQDLLKILLLNNNENIEKSKYLGIQSAVIGFLEGMAKYRGKLSEVLSAVNASANHGYLISTTRKIIQLLAVGRKDTGTDVVAHTEKTKHEINGASEKAKEEMDIVTEKNEAASEKTTEEMDIVTEKNEIVSEKTKEEMDIVTEGKDEMDIVSEEKQYGLFVEKLFSFVGYLLSTQVGGNMIIASGILPLLVSAVSMKDKQHLKVLMINKVVAKCTLMLDNLLYGFNTSLNIFSGINGIEVVVDRIEYEVEEALKFQPRFPVLPSTTTSLSTTQDHAVQPHTVHRAQTYLSPKTTQDPGMNSDYKELLTRLPLLRATLKLILHLCQNSGTADGMRNLVDSSLVKSLKKIFDHSILFGHLGAFGLATNIMSTFIHNEPTSLVVLQEHKLTESFLKASCQEIPVSAEVVSAIPNAFGAVCLNAVGLKEFMEYNPIPNFISLFTKEEHLLPLIYNDVPHLVGNSIDEFIRHHPSTKDIVMENIMEMIRTVVKIGESHEPKDYEGCYLIEKGKLERQESKMIFLIEVSSRVYIFLISFSKDYFKTRHIVKNSSNLMGYLCY
jgi:hypothetical protein